MLEVSPGDWPKLAGIRAKRVEVVDPDVSTVSAAADKVVRLHEPNGILHFEFQAGPDSSLPRRIHTSNGLLESQHEIPVLGSVLV
jgi:hypothetical protein